MYNCTTKKTKLIRVWYQPLIPTRSWNWNTKSPHILHTVSVCAVKWQSDRSSQSPVKSPPFPSLLLWAHPAKHYCTTTIKPLFISSALSCILLKCHCITYNKIHSLSFCLCRPPNHYCMADNATAASASQRWDGWLSSHSATHTRADNDISFRD